MGNGRYPALKVTLKIVVININTNDNTPHDNITPNSKTNASK
jgi:hypothetical protein